MDAWWKLKRRKAPYNDGVLEAGTQSREKVPDDKGVSLEKISSFSKNLKSEQSYILAQNVSTCSDPLEVCLHRKTVQDTNHVFQHVIPAEGKPVTNQKNSGRCWIFSCLNVMRLPFMKKFNIEEFEFSQSYLFFWDKMREYCLRLRNMVTSQAFKTEISDAIDGMMEEVYRVVSICLGSPPESFTWEYRDKEKNFHRIGPLTPLEFYREHVKPLYNVEDKICLVNDPRPQNPYGKLYCVEYLGNMVGGRKTLYNNQPIEKLKKVAADSIKEGEENKEDAYEKWRVENSWGDDRGNKGYLIMTDDWFSEYVYEVVVDKKFVSAEVLEVMKQEPVMLPAWDPMGALA
ncbi:BLMH hydrolase, partial [Polypterus senegalus]